MTIIVPDDIPSAVTGEEAARLASLASGGDVLELGAQYGFSTVVLAQAARRVTSVDWHQGDASITAMGGGPADTWEAYRQNLARYGVAAKVDARRGRFADVLPALAREGALFDGVFIDAQHDAAVGAGGPGPGAAADPARRVGRVPRLRPLRGDGPPGVRRDRRR